jgi:hypothetical protein
MSSAWAKAVTAQAHRHNVATFIITPDFRSHPGQHRAMHNARIIVPTILLPPRADPLPPLCRQFR